MAQFVDEGTEGNETRQSKPVVNLEQWLKQNRLKKLAPYFEDEEVVMDDLRTYNDTVIEFRFFSVAFPYSQIPKNGP